jgi:tetratricopeptide (TPR) repeat protein
LFLAAGLVLLAGAALVQAAPDPDKDEKDLKAQALALNDITGDEPTLGKIKSLLASPAETKKLLAAAAAMAKEKDQPFNYNALFILARTAHVLKEYDQAVVFYKKGRDKAEELKSGAKLGQTYAGLIDLYYEQKKFEDAEKLCKEFIEVDATDRTVMAYQIVLQRRMIQAIARQEKYDEAARFIDILLKRNPDDFQNLELRGWLERERGQFDKAAKTYEQVYEQINKDETLEEKEKKDYGAAVRYTLSNLYLELKNIDKVAEQLEALMKYQPENPTWYNDLGYIWADNDKNLDKSEEYVRKALDLDKKQREKQRAEKELAPEDDHDNPAYLDSLGWVLFKQKKYKEAKDPLLEAIKYKEGKHLEIYDHLGDVHMALGEKAEAVAAWKKGLEVASDSKRDKERKAAVEKKIKDAQ